MPATTRIYVVGTMAGAEPVWRTFLNTIALDVYKIDAAVLVGGLGVGGETAQQWQALADERLADSAIALTVGGALALRDGRRVPVCADDEALRATVAREAPALALCGGQPDTEPRKFWIGDTLCLDPGSHARRGALCGYVADLGPRGVRVAVPVRA